MDDKLIVALDFDDLEHAFNMAVRLREHVSWFKVGMEAWSDPKVHDLIEALDRQNLNIFLDLKLHDIPETITRTVRKITSRHKVGMMTVLGYPKTIKAAVLGAEDRTEIIPVNVLTSDDNRDLFTAGYTVTVDSLQGTRVDYAIVHGAAGVVCAAKDVRRLRNFTRGSIKIITPGIRLPGAAQDDQKRVATPFETLQAGATHYVVGRPITRAEDPIAAVQAFLANAAGEDRKQEAA